MNSIVKGKNAERQFARILERITKTKWNRVSCSGAMATAQNIQDSRFQGDLWSEDERFKDVVIECKSTKKQIRLEDIRNPKSLFWSWVRQAKGEAMGKDWALLFKANFGDTFMLSPLTSGFLQEINGGVREVAIIPIENGDLFIGCLDG